MNMLTDGMKLDESDEPDVADDDDLMYPLPLNGTVNRQPPLKPSFLS